VTVLWRGEGAFKDPEVDSELPLWGYPKGGEPGGFPFSLPKLPDRAPTFFPKSGSLPPPKQEILT